MTNYLQQQLEQQGVVQVYPCPFPSASAHRCTSPPRTKTHSATINLDLHCRCHMQASTDPPGASMTPLLMLGVSLSWTTAPTACEQGAWRDSSREREHNSIHSRNARLVMPVWCQQLSKSSWQLTLSWLCALCLSLCCGTLTHMQVGGRPLPQCHLPLPDLPPQAQVRPSK
jgi:hypothetical protein